MAYNSRPVIFSFQFAICNLHCFLSLPFSLCSLPFALSSLPLAPCRSERLREPKLNLALVQTIDRGEWRIGVQSLRDQKLRRIQNVSVVNRQRAAEGRLESRA